MILSVSQQIGILTSRLVCRVGTSGVSRVSVLRVCQCVFPYLVYLVIWCIWCVGVPLFRVGRCPRIVASLNLIVPVRVVIR